MKFISHIYRFIRVFICAGLLFVIASSCNNRIPDKVTDIDGNVYHTICIGKQVWMVENLKVTRYRNGDSIPKVTGRAKWTIQKEGAFCNYDNNDNNITAYGRLYNWFAVNDSRHIAPEGWHIPSDDEFNTLINYLGGDSIAGNKMKEPGALHWLAPNNAANKSGFSASPGGYRNDYDGNFFLQGHNGMLWSATENDTTAWIRIVNNRDASVFRNYACKPSGFSVRCIKD